jgi:hypothetical protein
MRPKILYISLPLAVFILTGGCMEVPTHKGNKDNPLQNLLLEEQIKLSIDEENLDCLCPSRFESLKDWEYFAKYAIPPIYQIINPVIRIETDYIMGDNKTSDCFYLIENEPVYLYFPGGYWKNYPVYYPDGMWFISSIIPCYYQLNMVESDSEIQINGYRFGRNAFDCWIEDCAFDSISDEQLPLRTSPLRLGTYTLTYTSLDETLATLELEVPGVYCNTY